MSIVDFQELLTRWQKSADDSLQHQKLSVSIKKSEAIKIAALAKMYGQSQEVITAELLSMALRTLEEAMPYVPGDKVIRVEEGENIYEDVGPTPRFIELQRELQSH